MIKVLVVDDEIQNREALTEVLERLLCDVKTASNGQEALAVINENSFDLVLCDIRMPIMDGIQFFEILSDLSKAHNQDLPRFVFMTAYGRLNEAVDLMRKGALHFLTKPVRKKDLQEIINDVNETKMKMRPKSNNAEKELNVPSIVMSKGLDQVLATIQAVAPSLASVLIVGESGTGKEVLARALHQYSHREKNPFIAFHSGAVPENLIESELFGYKKGSFTGAFEDRKGLIEQAQGGTFFIDELATMSQMVQVKLLRVIQEKEVQPLGSSKTIHCDVRWVSATNERLEDLISQNRLREDLLYRLKVVVIEIPPLRERIGDIEVLARSFIEEFCLREGRKILDLNDSVIDLLKNYPWPGNVRELRNVIERAVVLVRGDTIDKSLLPSHFLYGGDTAKENPNDIQVKIGTQLKVVEDKLIEKTLKSVNGDKIKAAAILGVTPRTIYRWIDRRIDRRIDR